MYLSILSYIYKVSQELLCVYVLILYTIQIFMWHNLVGCWGCYKNSKKNLRISTPRLEKKINSDNMPLQGEHLLIHYMNSPIQDDSK
jgi:hypothetical protein